LVDDKEVDLDLPKSTTDELTKKEIFKDSLNLNILKDKINKSKFTLTVKLTGCSDDGICYVPKIQFNLELQNMDNSNRDSFFFKDISKLQRGGNSKGFRPMALKGSLERDLDFLIFNFFKFLIWCGT